MDRDKDNQTNLDRFAKPKVENINNKRFIVVRNPKTNRIIDKVKYHKGRLEEYKIRYKKTGSFTRGITREGLRNVAEYSANIRKEGNKGVFTRESALKKVSSSRYQYYVEIEFRYKDRWFRLDARSELKDKSFPVEKAREEAIYLTQSRISNTLGFGYDTNDLDKFADKLYIKNESIIWYA